MTNAMAKIKELMTARRTLADEARTKNEKTVFAGEGGITMMMTKDLINNHKQIMIDAQNLFAIGAVWDSMGKSESFDRYFHEKYQLEAEIDNWYGIETEVLTAAQGAIYAEYTNKVARELFRLQHNR